MPAKVEFFRDKECKIPITNTLGELDIEKVDFYIKNTGDFVIKDVEITSTFTDAELKYHINLTFYPGEIIKCSLVFKEEGRKEGKIDVLGKSIGKP